MRKMIALFVSAAFLLGTTGLAVAQTATPPAQAPSTEKKADDKTIEKKPAKKAMTTEEKKAACLQKAGTDEAKKASCEKKYAAKGEKGTDKKGAMKEEEKKK